MNMTRATVRFIRDWTNSCGQQFAAGSTFSSTGKNDVRARANVARRASAWIHEQADGRVLVSFLSREPIAIFVE